MPDEIKKRLRSIDLAAAVVLAVVVVAAVALGVVPLHHFSSLNVVRASELEHKLTEFDGLNKMVEKARTDLKVTQQRLHDAESRLPSEGEMAQFMQQLAHVADTAGLQVDGITPGTVQPAGSYRALPIEIVGSGDFGSCYKFLQGLRQLNRLTRLDDLVVQAVMPGKGGPVTPSSTCTIHVTISTFMAR